MNNTKEVAEQIVLRGYGTTWKTDAELVTVIDSTLRQREQEVLAEERERATKIFQGHISSVECDHKNSCAIEAIREIRSGV